jgi:hypothetical protein
VLVWDVVYVRSDLSFISLCVTKLSVLDPLADGGEKEKPDLRLEIDVDIYLRPDLLACRGLLGTRRLSADGKEQEKKARNQKQRFVDMAAPLTWQFL